MKYLLRITTFDKVPDIEITAVEYNELENARRILLSAQAIEVKYDIMISNYLEFEKQILHNTATTMVRNITDYSSLFEIRHSLNIRLVNLLTSVRMYVDQLNQDVSRCVSDVLCIKKRVNSLFSIEYDKNISYRFMEALRNYVQHRGLPVHWTQQGARWTSSEDDGLFEYNLELSSDLSYLKSDPKFKKKVLNAFKEKADLKTATRSYVESISNVHESARNIIFNSVSKARELIENTHLRFPIKYGNSMSSLCAVKQIDKGDQISIPLLLDWDNIRLELQKRNKKLTNLRKRYVTSIIKVRNE